MKPAKHFHLSILCVAVLLGSGQLATAKRAISEQEFRTQVVGKSWKYKDPKGNTGRLKFYSSGAIAVSFTPKGKKTFKDKGSWRWSGSQYCTKYRKIRKGKEKCYHLHKHGKGFIEPGTKGVMYWAIVYSLRHRMIQHCFKWKAWPIHLSGPRVSSLHTSTSSSNLSNRAQQPSF